MIAALYVQSKGAYFGLPDVDPWDDTRPRLRSKEASATPPAFREILLSIARSIQPASQHSLTEEA